MDKKKRSLWFFCIATLALLLGFGIFALIARVELPKNAEEIARKPKIYPDYDLATIPCNIAPLNFQIEEVGREVRCVLYGERQGADGARFITNERSVCPDVKVWRKLLHENSGGRLVAEVYVKGDEDGKWRKFQALAFDVSQDAIDEWLAYRLLAPGYDYGGWITLEERNLTNFETREIFDNRGMGTCVNCHAFQNRRAEKFSIHYRVGGGAPGSGTIIGRDGALRKIDGKVAELNGRLSYPAWRPTGDLAVFSSNKTFQALHNLSTQKIEALDSESDLVLVDTRANRETVITNTPDEFETFPNWSQDGKTLYYASANVKLAAPVWQGQRRAEEGANRIEDFRYNIYKREFDEKTLTFSEPTLVVDARARERSAVHPKISPDGKWLVYTQMASGTFPLWRPEADLWIKNLATGEERPLEEVNDRYAESYHAWSSSGRWLAFSSRREDGQYARVYLAHIDESGRASKPFVTPQANPLDNRQNFRAYNVPEFIVEPIPFSKREIFNAARGTGENTTGSGQARAQNSAEIETYFN